MFVSISLQRAKRAFKLSDIPHKEVKKSSHFNKVSDPLYKNIRPLGQPRTSIGSIKSEEPLLVMPEVHLAELDQFVERAAAALINGVGDSKPRSLYPHAKQQYLWRY